jgi:hypothetical protein
LINLVADFGDSFGEKAQGVHSAEPTLSWRAGQSRLLGA